jgi:hypothetical protein
METDKQRDVKANEAPGLKTQPRNAVSLVDLGAALIETKGTAGGASDLPASATRDPIP